MNNVVEGNKILKDFGALLPVCTEPHPTG